MAITSTNPYGSGGKVLNSTPYLQYFLQTRAHEAAQKAALDNHFNKLNESINPAGVRHQDVDGFMKRVNDNRDFYNQNKKAIQNPVADNGKAYSEFMSRHQAALGYINNSKQEATNAVKAAPIFTNPSTRDRLAQKTVDDYKLSELPLDHPDHKSFDASSVDFDPKDFDLAAQTNYSNNRFKHIPIGDLSVTEKVDPKTQEVFRTTVKGHSDDNLKKIIDIARQDAYSDPSIAFHLKNLPPDVEGAAHGSLNDSFQKIMGRPIQSKEDLFGAMQAQAQQQQATKISTSPYWTGRNAITYGQQLEKQNRQQGITRSNMVFHKNLTDSGKSTAGVEGIVNGGFDVANIHTTDGGKIENGIAINAQGQPHKGKVTVPIEKVNSNISAAINALDKDNSISKDDNGLATFYTDDKGRLAGVLTRRGVFKLPEQVAGSKKAAGVSAKNRGNYTGTSSIETPAPKKASARLSKDKPFFLK